MSLFGGLPAARSGGRKEEGPEAKRQRVDGPKEAATPDPVPPKPAAAPGGDDVLAALGKIESHIVKEKKFVKASALARKLLEGGALKTGAHKQQMYRVLEAAMGEEAHVALPALHAEYSDLIGAALDHSAVFSPAQKRMLAAWEISAVWRSAMFTDDSFEFNKVIKDVNKAIAALPDATEEEEAPPPPPPAPAPTPAPAPPEEDEEDDIFGLAAIIPAPAAPAPPSSAVSDAAILQARRAALAGCLETAFTFYRKKWAQTTLDMMVRGAHESLSKFGTSPSSPLWGRVMKVYKDTTDARLARQQGIVRGGGGDKTTFEKTQDSYKGRTISARSAVGAGADHKQEMWLG